jgi:hypothetical protein
MNFQDKSIQEIFAAFQSSALYYLDEESEEQGVNYVSSDSLRIRFKNKEIQEIQVYGAAQGTYYPADFKGAIKDDD